MKILLVSYSGYGAWFSLRLLEEGHSVDYYLLDKKYEGVLCGIAPVPLKREPRFEEYDLVLFDLTGRPALAEKAARVTPVLGDGNLQTQLEDDRLFGIEVMEECGIGVPPYEVFSDIEEAKEFIKKTKKAYVFKPFGGQEQGTETTYVSDSADDLLDYIDKLGELSKGAEFLLQEVVEGTEISTEAWFNGEDFFLVNSTLEEKKLMNDGKGPATGCSGNVVWTYDDEPRIFTEGIGKLKKFLQEYKYAGMVDLNTIVTPTTLYGLEWTPRFGYDASATLFALIESDLGEFFLDITSGNKKMKEPIINGKFAASVRISIPPYPTEFEVDGLFKEGCHISGIDHDDIARGYYLYDACCEDGEALKTAGVNGMVVVPITVGSSIEEAFELLDKRIEKIKIPDCQYRTDIMEKVSKRYKILKRQGWL